MTLPWTVLAPVVLWAAIRIPWLVATGASLDTDTLTATGLPLLALGAAAVSAVRSGARRGPLSLGLLGVLTWAMTEAIADPTAARVLGLFHLLVATGGVCWLAPDRVRGHPTALLVAGGAFATHAAVLVGRWPALSSLPGWFWNAEPLPETPWGTMAGWAILAAGGVWVALRPAWPVAIRLGVLIGLGTALHYGTAAFEQRGLDAMTDRMVLTGHAEFVDVAVAQTDPLAMVADYEARVRKGDLGEYAKSKPPGHLLFYVATGRLADAWTGPVGLPARADALRSAAVVLWPALSFLTLVPLFGIARTLTDTPTAMLAAALYVFVPSAQLVVLHTDQVLFPLVSLVAVWLAVTAYRSDRPVVAFAAGCATWVALFCSLGLLALLPLLFVPAWFLVPRSASPDGRFRPVVRQAALVLAGLLAADVLARIGFGYDIVARYTAATAHHAAWKAWDPAPPLVLYFAALNSLEYAVWLGPALSVMALFGLRRDAPLRWWAVLLAAILTMLAWFGQTKGEVARLWLFLMPCCCIAGARAMVHHLDARGITAVVGMQAATVALTKLYQDFW